MKTNRILMIFATVVFFALASCAEKKCDCDQCPSQSQTSSKPPKQAISYKQAKVLEQEYVKTRAIPLNKILNEEGVIKGEDVRDVWFDLEVMKQYINYVEAQSKTKGYKGLGLRVYYGAYPKNAEAHDPGYATVFFIPTYRAKKGMIPVSNFVQQDSTNFNNKDLEGLNFGSNGHPPTKL